MQSQKLFTKEMPDSDQMKCGTVASSSHAADAIGFGGSAPGGGICRIVSICSSIPLAGQSTHIETLPVCHQPTKPNAHTLNNSQENTTHNRTIPRSFEAASYR